MFNFSSDVLAVLLIATLVICSALTVLVIARKGNRDRREAQFAKRRRRYQDTLLHGEADHLVAIAAEARREAPAQVDLAIALEVVHERLAPERLDKLGEAALEAGLIETLVHELHSRRAIVRGRAALLMTRPGLPNAVEVVAPLLSDPDPDVRLVAVGGLARVRSDSAARALIVALTKGVLAPERIVERLGAPWAVDTIVAALRDGVPEAAPKKGRPRDLTVPVRASLAKALGLAGDPRAEGTLLGLLADGGEEEQVSAARALGSVGCSASVPALIAALERPEWPVRAQAAKSLGRLGDPAAVPALEAKLGDSGWWVRANAARSLRGLGKPGIAALRRALASDDAYARDRASEQLALHEVEASRTHPGPQAVAA